MDKIISIFTGAPQINNHNDDDFADRMSNRYSVLVCILFALVVGMNQYGGSPIQCWAPVHFASSHIKYTNSFCWVKNTYYLPWQEEVPRADDEHQTVPYYQWIPFVLIIQAMLFYAPSIVWHGLNSKAGVDADNILAVANSFARAETVTTREKTMQLMTNQIDRFLESRKQENNFSCDMKSIISATCCRLCGKRLGNYLVLLFLFTKLFYIANVIGQMFLLNIVLGTKFNLYGFQIMTDMVADHDWTEAPNVVFPRVTLCDFHVRRLGNVHRYTVQCALPINMYNEKIYIFLWFWMVMVAAMSVGSLLIWLIRFMCKSDRVKFVRNHLKSGGRVQPHKDTDASDRFVSNYLRQDGCFLLRLISHNSNHITTTEVTCSLWDLWKNKKSQKNSERSPLEEEDGEEEKEVVDIDTVESPKNKLYPSVDPDSDVVEMDDLKGKGKDI